MLDPIRARRLTPEHIVDRSERRDAIADWQGQPVLFSGGAYNPRLAAKDGTTYAGGPEYTIGGGSPGNRSLRSSPHGVIVQRYDPEGRLSPAEMGTPVAVDHLNVRQMPVWHNNNLDGETVSIPAVYREVSGPVVGTGVVNKYPAADRYGVYETPFPIASHEYTRLLQEIALLPPEQRMQAFDAARQHLGELHYNQAIAYDVTTQTISDALARAEAVALEHGDLSAKLKSLQLPQYVPPAVQP